MKKSIIVLPLILLGAGVLLNSQTSPPASAPGGVQTQVVSHADVSRLITEIGQQQLELAKNQIEITKQLDLVSESVRQARIFAARKGGGDTK